MSSALEHTELLGHNPVVGTAILTIDDEAGLPIVEYAGFDPPLVS